MRLFVAMTAPIDRKLELAMTFEEAYNKILPGQILDTTVDMSEFSDSLAAFSRAKQILTSDTFGLWRDENIYFTPMYHECELGYCFFRKLESNGTMVVVSSYKIQKEQAGYFAPIKIVDVKSGAVDSYFF